MIARTSCPRCGTHIVPAWKHRVGLKADELAVRSLAEEAADWFRIHYPDPWPVIIARRQALNADMAGQHPPGRRST